MAIEYEKSSGNIFKDLGFENPEKEDIKAKILIKRQKLIRRSKLLKKNNFSFRECIDRANAWIDIDECEIKEVKPGYISIKPPSK